MGIMIDMPAAIIQQANEYAERNGCSFRDLLCQSVEMYLAEQEQKRKAGKAVQCTFGQHRKS